jgi:DNA-binding NtrC family response regulator
MAREVDYDVVLSDIKMPGRSGIELVGELRQFRRETPVILMTAFGSIDSAVEAMRAGALDYITKPFEPDVGIGACGVRWIEPARSAI